jgi:hypothetical protein
VDYITYNQKLRTKFSLNSMDKIILHSYWHKKTQNPGIIELTVRVDDFNVQTGAKTI